MLITCIAFLAFNMLHFDKLKLKLSSKAKVFQLSLVSFHPHSGVVEGRQLNFTLWLIFLVNKQTDNMNL